MGVNGANLSMNEMWEFGRISDEEDGRIVEDPVKIPLVCLQFDREPTRITGGIRGPRFTADSGKADGCADLLAHRFKQRGRSQATNVMGYFKVAVCTGTLGVNLGGQDKQIRAGDKANENLRHVQEYALGRSGLTDQYGGNLQAKR